jgi:HD superfamily phosphohydrolase
MKSAEYQIFNLTANFTETIRDPLWKDIPLSSGFKKLFLSEPMQKLNRIKQLGPTYLLYPGALHNRASHSLGVFHLTRLIILSLLSRSSGYGIIPSFSDSQINALLAASMLHDLGHFPYAHALKDIVKEEHEKLGATLIKQDEQLCSIIEKDLNSSVDAICQIIDNKSECNDEVISFFRTILSGTLDPDKLDYLSRDALFCGVPYGEQDASYIIRNLVVTKEMILALPFDAIGSVEHLLFAKYSMYRNVYWHHVTRSATAMIKKAVLLAFEENLFCENDLYNLDDESFANLFYNHKKSYAYSLFKDVRNNNLYKCHASLYTHHLILQ